MFLSRLHIEPLGVSVFTYFNYWKTKNDTKPLFSYFSNKAEFLSANFLSQAYFMKGHSQKLEFTVFAKQAVENGNRAKALKYLQLALECFSDIRKAKILSTQSQWTDWYRSDEKMNFKVSESSLTDLINELH